MNIYEKMQTMRVKLQSKNLNKSGENKFAGYKYYELGDFLPTINMLMMEHKCMGAVTFTKEEAILTIVDCEKPEAAPLVFTSPMAEVSLKGAHDIQNLGAVETYQRRYLYMAAFEIVESDFFDATQGAPQPEQQTQRKKTQNNQKKLSEDMSARLNDAVKGYASMTGKTTKEIMADIQKEIGKPSSQMDDIDGELVLEIINGWSEMYIEELGV